MAIEQELQRVSPGWGSPFTYAANNNPAGRAALAQVTSIAASHGFSTSGPVLLGDGRLQSSYTPTAAQKHSGVRVSRAGVALASLVLLVVAANLANLMFTGQSQDATGAFAAFKSHAVSATVEEAGPKVLALYTDARAGNVAAAKADAQTLGSWARGETAWLASHPAGACYAAVYGVWTGMVAHAQEASDAVLAGNYSEAASETDAFSFATSDLTSMLDQVRC